MKSGRTGHERISGFSRVAVRVGDEISEWKILPEKSSFAFIFAAQRRQYGGLKREESEIESRKVVW